VASAFGAPAARRFTAIVESEERAMRTRSGFSFVVLGAGLLSWLSAAPSSGQSTAFTYQGRLLESGQPRDGSCDFEFHLFDALSGGNEVAEADASNGVEVADGLFTTRVDFGAAAFTGEDRWLQIRVRCPAGQGSFTALAPRQPVTPAPYAISAPLVGRDLDGNVQVEAGVTDQGAGFLETAGPNGTRNVLIGHFTDFPDEGLVAVYDVEGFASVQMSVSDGGAGFVETIGLFGDTNVLISNLEDFPDNGFVGVYSEGEIVAGMYATEENRGLVFADEKDFVVDHPQRPGYKILYTSLEGPEAAIYHRGVVKLREGRATIELPEHFRSLASPATLTVQLTPRSLDSLGVAVGSIGDGRIEVGELHAGKGSYDVYYVVHAVRRGYEDRQAVLSREQFHAAFPSVRARAARQSESGARLAARSNPDAPEPAPQARP
jgi:hypothetical protein